MAYSSENIFFYEFFKVVFAGRFDIHTAHHDKPADTDGGGLRPVAAQSVGIDAAQEGNGTGVHVDPLGNPDIEASHEAEYVYVHTFGRNGGFGEIQVHAAHKHDHLQAAGRLPVTAAGDAGENADQSFILSDTAAVYGGMVGGIPRYIRRVPGLFREILDQLLENFPVAGIGGQFQTAFEIRLVQVIAGIGGFQPFDHLLTRYFGNADKLSFVARHAFPVREG